MMTQLSIAFQTDKPLNAYGPLAAQAEAYGFDGVTVYNDMLYQQAWLPLLLPYVSLMDDPVLHQRCAARERRGEFSWIAVWPVCIAPCR